MAMPLLDEHYCRTNANQKQSCARSATINTPGDTARGDTINIASDTERKTTLGFLLTVWTRGASCPPYALPDLPPTWAQAPRGAPDLTSMTTGARDLFFSCSGPVVQVAPDSPRAGGLGGSPGSDSVQGRPGRKYPARLSSSTQGIVAVKCFSIGSGLSRSCVTVSGHPNRQESGYLKAVWLKFSVSTERHHTLSAGLIFR